jgi:hypothetical protein
MHLLLRIGVDYDDNTTLAHRLPNRFLPVLTFNLTKAAVVPIESVFPTSQLIAHSAKKSQRSIEMGVAAGLSIDNRGGCTEAIHHT